MKLSDHLFKLLKYLYETDKIYWYDDGDVYINSVIFIPHFSGWRVDFTKGSTYSRLEIRKSEKECVLINKLTRYLDPKRVDVLAAKDLVDEKKDSYPYLNLPLKGRITNIEQYLRKFNALL